MSKNKNNGNGKTIAEVIETNNRLNIFVKIYAAVFAIVLIAESIGTKTFKLGPGEVVLLPMLFAVVIGILITPDILGSKLAVLRTLIDDDVMELAAPMVMISLLPLGVKYGTLVGPNIVEIVQAGPALLLQELGNLGTIFVSLPVALLLGMKREAVGATTSIAREPTLGVIGEKYGIDSPEGIGVLGTYLTGTVFGTVFFGILGAFSTVTGLHPFALAMGTGMGSGSMMAAGSGSLAEAVPEMSDTILAYAATSNMLTGVTGLYMVIFVALPLTNFLYDKLEPILGRSKKKEENK
ncbi:MAG: DUF3100 domain-containing protein [Bacillota bacterium]